MKENIKIDNLTVGVKYEDLKDGQEFMYRQSDNEWVRAKIHHHWRGSLMVEILEGRLKGKDWYLFPTSMDRMRPVT